MPLKIGSHSKAAEDVADAVFDHLRKCTGSTGQPTFEYCILAFVDKPGVAKALGFATNVMLDKSKKTHFKRKLFSLPNGESLRLNCEPRILLTSREELAQSYLDSEQQSRLLEEDTRRSLCLRTAQECICDCIKEAKNEEMICSVCIGFKYLIEAWEKMRTDARKNGESCSCPECVPGSSVTKSVFMASIINVWKSSAF